MPISNTYMEKTPHPIYLANTNTNQEKYIWEKNNAYPALVVIECLHTEFHKALKLKFPFSLFSSLKINHCVWTLELWPIVNWAEIM